MRFEVFTTLKMWTVAFRIEDEGDAFIRNVDDRYMTARHHNPEDHSPHVRSN
jgi:hypothetical protein